MERESGKSVQIEWLDDKDLFMLNMHLTGGLIYNLHRMLNWTLTLYLSLWQWLFHLQCKFIGKLDPYLVNFYLNKGYFSVNHKSYKWSLVCVCVYDDTYAAQQIWGCLLDICVAMCSKSHDRKGFDQINFLIFCVCVYVYWWF